VTVDVTGGVQIPKRNMRGKRVSFQTVHVSHLKKQMIRVSCPKPRHKTLVCIKHASYTAVC
jgi:hypothetical protein